MSEQNKTKSPKAKPPKTKSKQQRLKLSEGLIIALLGLVGTIIASLLGSPLIGKWFVSTPVPTISTTNAITLTLQPTVQSQTQEPIPEPVEIFDSTATPATTEITDAKGVQMVFIPSGEFTMGSDSGFPDEKPVHAVTLDAYYIDKYEVTNALYKVCVSAGICQPPQNKSSYTRSNYYESADFDNYPVIYVNWNMAKTYCEWRGAQLPTEAQWEKAARGVDGRVYPWGHSFDGTVVNFCDLNCTLQWSDRNYDDRYEEIAPVGSYPHGISPYGIYNMVGNVFEWVADWYGASYYMTTIGRNIVNPPGPSDGRERVMRGSSWYYTKTDMYSSYRTKSNPVDIYYDVGFRCAKGENP